MAQPASEEPMRIHRAERAWEWNLNTVVQLVGLAMLSITAAGVWFGLRGDVKGLLDWKVEHEAEVKERRGEIEGDLSRLGAQIGSLDERLDGTEALSARLSDRVSATEARSAEFAQTLRELQASINQQSGDLKVILSWIEEQRRQSQASGRR